jgi:flagellar secretion chaperone FliS
MVMFTTYPASRPQARAAGHLYREVAVESAIGGSADSHRLVAMLFAGFSESVAQARGALREGRVSDKGLAIGRALRIIEEGLRANLDRTAGGKLAHDLHELYGYVGARLMHANLRNDESALEECARLIQPLAAAWNEIDPATHGARHA